MFHYLFVLMVIIVGVIFRITWSYVSRRSRKNWLSTEGIVYTYRIGVKHDSNGEEFSEPGMKCLYKVDGITYTLNLEYPNYWNCTQREWENVFHYYPSGFTVTVQYDPHKPVRACVKP